MMGRHAMHCDVMWCDVMGWDDMVCYVLIGSGCYVMLGGLWHVAV